MMIMMMAMVIMMMIVVMMLMMMMMMIMMMMGMDVASLAVGPAGRQGGWTDGWVDGGVGGGGGDGPLMGVGLAVLLGCGGSGNLRGGIPSHFFRPPSPSFPTILLGWPNRHGRADGAVARLLIRCLVVVVCACAGVCWTGRAFGVGPVWLAPNKCMCVGVCAHA